MLRLAGHIGGTKTDSSRRAVRLSRLTQRYDGQGTRLCLKSRRRSSLGLLIRTAPTQLSQTTTRGLGARGWASHSRF
jgi:hypothetical protein